MGLSNQSSWNMLIILLRNWVTVRGLRRRKGRIVRNGWVNFISSRRMILAVEIEMLL